MTPDERAALVERVAKAMYERWQSTRTNAPSWDLLYTSSRDSEIADAVVALDLLTPIIRAQALEEAAKALDAEDERHAAIIVRQLIPSEEKKDV